MDDSKEIEFFKSVGYKVISDDEYVTCYGLHYFDNNFIIHLPVTDNWVIGGTASGVNNLSFIEAVEWLGLYNKYKLWNRSKVIKKIRKH